jgi:hypothetical protein
MILNIDEFNNFFHFQLKRIINDIIFLNSTIRNVMRLKTSYLTIIINYL